MESKYNNVMQHCLDAQQAVFGIIFETKCNVCTILYFDKQLNTKFYFDL
jgi:hypothetical protein